jgi:4-amino-4-deoxy-L-arabinose transferase-like glycosyltransferase
MTHKYLILVIVLLCGLFLEIWKIGQHPAEEWDEARRGINALGMIYHDDYLQYHYLNEVDTFNTKPPLTVWLIALNFKIFGVSHFALRFHSIIAILLFFYFSIKLVLLYRDKIYAALFLGIIISVQGIIGFHVGRSGDTDSLLLFFLMAFVYYFLLYRDFGKQWSLYVAALFFGLAFYTKSVAAFIIIPGMLFYLLITGDRKSFFKKEFIISMVIALLFVFSWGVLSTFGNQEGSSDNSLWERIFSIDLYQRFTDRDFEAGYDPFYIIHVLDMNFNIWNYILYLGGIVGLYRVIKLKNQGLILENRLRLFSLSVVTSYIVILTLSMNKHQWYLAPALPFFAILTVEFIYFLKERVHLVLTISFFLIGILVLIRFREFNNPDRTSIEFFDQHREIIEKAECLLIDRQVPQDLVFECVKWNYGAAKLTDTMDESGRDQLYFGPALPDGNLIKAGEIEGYYLWYHP